MTAFVRFLVFTVLIFSYCVCAKDTDSTSSVSQDSNSESTEQNSDSNDDDSDTDKESMTFNIGTWNSFDIYHSNDRDARRNFAFSNKQQLFGDLDILCTQESFSYQSINDFNTNFGELFPYSYYHNNPSSRSSYQACLESEIEYLVDNTSSIYECNNICIQQLPSTLSYVFCFWRCFGVLRHNITGITTRNNNAQLFDFGELLEFSPCLTCLWKSKYVNMNMTQSWDTADANIIFEDIFSECTSTTNTFDYKPNEGIILWSKYKFDSIEYISFANAVFMPRGGIIGTFNDDRLSIICIHLETPTINGYFGDEFTTMNQDNIDNGVTQMSDITEIEIKELIDVVNHIDGNIIVLGDFNLGINSRIDLYDELLVFGGLSNVFGSNDELIESINCSRCDTNPYTSNHEIIDHILVKGDFDIENADRFIDGTYDTTDGLIPLSDHYGIRAQLQITSITETVDSSSVNSDSDIESNSDEAMADHSAEHVEDGALRTASIAGTGGVVIGSVVVISGVLVIGAVVVCVYFYKRKNKDEYDGIKGDEVDVEANEERCDNMEMVEISVEENETLKLNGGTVH